MRIGIISDIHSNMEALNTVLEGLRGDVDEIICLGDIIGYGPNPRECCDIVRDNKIYSICGNHDSACYDDSLIDYFNPLAREAIIWTRSQLTQDYLDYLRRLPFEDVLYGLRIVHGAPGEPFEYITTIQDARAAFISFDEDVCFIGHSHIMEYFELKKGSVIIRQLPLRNKQELSLEEDKRYIINTGSVGQPRDGDPRSACIIYDTSEKRLTAHRVPYKIDIVQKKMQLKGLPQILWERLGVGR
ncbi:TPA: metallophosphoesterase family protein [bacterium]|nr:metallophosphoesterase family protein [bacterium]